jgi:hypothetical protein
VPTLKYKVNRGLTVERAKATLAAPVGDRLSALTCYERAIPLVCLTTSCSRLELHLRAVLRAARPIVELGPPVAAADDRGRCVVGIHD